MRLALGVHVLDDQLDQVSEVHLAQHRGERFVGPGLGQDVVHEHRLTHVRLDLLERLRQGLQQRIAQLGAGHRLDDLRELRVAIERPGQAEALVGLLVEDLLEVRAHGVRVAHEARHHHAVAGASRCEVDEHLLDLGARQPDDLRGVEDLIGVDDRDVGLGDRDGGDVAVPKPRLEAARRGDLLGRVLQDGEERDDVGGLDARVKPDVGEVAVVELAGERVVRGVAMQKRRILVEEPLLRDDEPQLRLGAQRLVERLDGLLGGVLGDVARRRVEPHRLVGDDEGLEELLDNERNRTLIVRIGQRSLLLGAQPRRTTSR